MTSKNSFFNSLLTSVRARIWGMAAAFILLMFALPIYAGITIASITNQIKYSPYLAAKAQEMFAKGVFGGQNVLLMIAIMILSVILAYNGYSYLFSKQKIDLYHSLPVKREVLFGTNYIAGIIAIIIPLAFWNIITIIIGAAFGLVSGMTIAMAIGTFAFCLLGFALIYSMTILAIIMTANVPVSLLATAVFALYGPSVALLYEGMMNIFYLTYSSYSANANMVLRLSPVTVFGQTFLGLGDEVAIVRLIYVVLFWAVITVAAYILFKIRPSEAAGKSMAFKKTMTPIAVLLLIPIALAGGLAFKSIIEGKANGWFVFGIVISLIIGHIIIQAIYYFDFKAIIKNPVNIGAAGLVVLVISLVCIFDLTGYDTYIPSDNKLESAAITSYAMEPCLDYYNFDAEPDESGWTDVWVDSEQYRLDNMYINDKEVIKEFCQAAIEDSREFDEVTAQGGDTGDAYNKMCSFVVKFRLSNGKDVYRTYTLNMDKNFETFRKVYAQKEYKEAVFTALSDIEYGADDKWFLSIPADEYDLGAMLSKAEIDKIVAAYRQDLINQDAQSIKDEVPVALLYKKHMYTNEGENSYVSTYSCDKAYIYPSFKNTLALIEEAGIDVEKYRDVSNISSITIRNWHTEATDYYGDSEMAEYTDEESIKAIMDSLVASEYSSTESVFGEYEDLGVSIQYKDYDPRTFYGTLDGSFYKGKTPEFVAKDVNFSQ